MSWVKTNKDFEDSFDKMLGREKHLGINFGDFDLDIPSDPFNRKAAEKISVLLINRASLDDLGPCAWEIEYDNAAEYPRTTIGGGGMSVPAPSLGNIYAMLANGFAHYALGKGHTFFIGKLDYYHLKDTLEYYSDEYYNEVDTTPLEKTLNQFCVHFSDYDKKFLLEMVK